MFWWQQYYLRRKHHFPAKWVWHSALKCWHHAHYIWARHALFKQPKWYCLLLTGNSASFILAYLIPRDVVWLVVYWYIVLSILSNIFHLSLIPLLLDLSFSCLCLWHHFYIFSLDLALCNLWNSYYSSQPEE